MSPPIEFRCPDGASFLWYLAGAEERTDGNGYGYSYGYSYSYGNGNGNGNGDGNGYNF